MAYPPGVTIKDYTWNGSAGYLNPKRDGKPERFPSIIQIVPRRFRGALVRSHCELLKSSRFARSRSAVVS